MNFLNKFIVVFFGCFFGFKASGSEDYSLPNAISQKKVLEKIENKIDDHNFSSSIQDINKLKNLDQVLVEEELCFYVDRIYLDYGDDYSLYEGKDFYFLNFKLNKNKFIINSCIGEKTLSNILKYTQNEIINAGYLTTQVSIPEQDLSKKILKLKVNFGRIHRLISKNNNLSYSEIYMAFPIEKNDILNIKKIDQGLDNLRKTSGRNVQIEIEPVGGNDKSGLSNLIIISSPYKVNNINLSLDDSGNENTGKYLGNLAYGLNNLLKINDILNMNINHSLNNFRKDLNKSFYVSYSFPIGNYDFLASYNNYEYEQSVSGFNKPITYSGKNIQSNFKISRLLSRGSNYKTITYFGGYTKESQNYVENIKIKVQERKTTGWNFGLIHTHYLSGGTLNLKLNYKRGTGGLNSQPAPEEQIRDIFGKLKPAEGYARAPLWNAEFNYSKPLFISNQQFEYRLNWKGQYAPKILIPHDRFFIGGRNSVRGFDGEIMLSGDNGHYLQQEINWKINNLPSQLYFGLDQGWVMGRNTKPDQKYLLGAVSGIRTNFKNLYLDAFLGRGVISPESINKKWVGGFSLSFSY